MNFLPWPYNARFALIAYPAIYIFPLAYLYSLVLTRGIACARDEQHRMTPLSPWFYFWMKSKRPLILTACLAPPWLLLAHNFIFVTVFYGGAAWSDAIVWTWQDVVIGDYVFILLYLGILGLASLILATITGFAPRNWSPLLLTTFGLSLALPFWGIFVFAAIDKVISPNQFHVRIPLFALLGLLSLILTWLHVRFRLNRAWFRFDDS